MCVYALVRHFERLKSTKTFHVQNEYVNDFTGFPVGFLSLTGFRETTLRVDGRDTSPSTTRSRRVHRDANEKHVYTRRHRRGRLVRSAEDHLKTTVPSDGHARGSIDSRTRIFSARARGRSIVFVSVTFNDRDRLTTL